MNVMRKTLDRETRFLDIASEGKAIAARIGAIADILIEDMELLHGQEFRAVIDHDAPMILIRPK